MVDFGHVGAEVVDTWFSATMLPPTKSHGSLYRHPTLKAQLCGPG